MPATKRTIAVLDADSHVLEPDDVWTTYLEAKHRPAARKAFWREHRKGGVTFVVNGKAAKELPTPNLPRHAIWKPGMTPKRIGGMDLRKRHAPNPGASNAKARLKDMDAMGVRQALLYPTYFLEYFPIVDDAQAAAALARAYNRWLADFCRAAPRRLFPVAVLPWQDVELAIAEAQRVAQEGFKAALVRPINRNGRFFHQPYFRPLWGEMERLGLTLCIHPSSGPAAVEWETNAPFVERVSANMKIGHPVADLVANTMDSGVSLVAMMADGMMEKYPKLKTMFAHSGCAWLPVTLEKIETYLWLSQQADPVSLEPEHVYMGHTNAVTFDSCDGSVRRMHGLFKPIAAWGSRYPNQETGTAKEAVADLKKGGAPAATIARLMGGNARRVLAIPG
ncbi:MAG: hypothetical protein FJ039_06530 [Chloroflexi bacterium]|nr:hypothetical protein [Chloroflexota bacterium]